MPGQFGRALLFLSVKGLFVFALQGQESVAWVLVDGAVIWQVCAGVRAVVLRKVVDGLYFAAAECNRLGI